jgi:hypothetical protein
MVNGDLATAVNGTTADNDTAVKPAVTRDVALEVTRDVALDVTREGAWDLPGRRGGPADLTDDSPADGRPETTTPTDPVAAELARLRRSLDHAVDLYEGYRESAAERALRITELLSDLDERETRLAQLRSEVQLRTREHEQQLAKVHRRYQSLRQRRGVRLALRLASVVKRVRGPSGRSLGS